MTHQDDPTPELTELAKGFRARTLVTARLATKLGLKYAKNAVGMTTVVEAAKAAEAATRLVKEMGALKGLVMKAGQLASYMPGSMPPEAQRILAKLQAESTSMAYPRIEAVIRREFGAGPADLFDTFESRPFAAASIGQVHRAKLGGRDVAVKVQYPGMEELMRGDLKLVTHMAQLSSLGTAVKGKAVAEELRDRLLEECDYLLEAENQTNFRALFGGRRHSRVPEVVPERTTKRVLTSEFIEGQGFYAFCDHASRELKVKAGETIFGTCFESIFTHCVYNADPHPGNYLFHADGGVTFLDYGCVRRFQPEMIERWKCLALSVLDGDRARFKDATMDLGMVGRPKKFDWDFQWKVMEYLYLPFRQKTPFTYTHDYVRESYDLLIFKNVNRLSTAMPPEWLFLNRLQWGMNSVLAHLGATGRWPELWRGAVESLTAPPPWVTAPPRGASGVAPGRVARS